MKKIILLALIALCSACDFEGNPNIVKHKKFRSFVVFYNEMDALNLHLQKEGSTDILLRSSSKKTYDSRSIDTDKEIYDNLCIKNNDMSFNQNLSYMIYSENELPSSFVFDFERIEVFSNTDFDATHSAGTSLSDIIQAEYTSYKPFIDNNYTLVEESASWIPKIPTTNKKLSDLSPKDLYLLKNEKMWAFMRLSFTQTPTINQPHTITVKLHETSGKVYTDSVVVSEWK